MNRFAIVLLALLALPAIAATTCVSSYAGDISREVFVPLRDGLTRDKQLIYDGECFNRDFGRAIAKRWYPPRDSGHLMVVKFKLNDSGKASDVRMALSSGSGITDAAAMKAVSDAYFEPLLVGEAEMQADFRKLALPNLHPTVSVILIRQQPDKMQVSFVRPKIDAKLGLLRVECPFHIKLNNQGVASMLKGDRSAAEKAFGEALVHNPNYAPARHNLKILQSTK